MRFCSIKTDGVHSLAAVPDDWRFDNKAGSFHTQVAALDIENGLGGYACSQGYRSFGGFGWCAVILQPAEYAFAQIGQLWEVILVFLAATLILCILLSLWLSEKFARPIVKLAGFTRDFMVGEKIEFPAIKASGEVAELSRQFSTMINNLEQSRQDIVRVAKLAVVGEMAASMAHEVRTPLGILRSSAQLLEREAGLSGWQGTDRFYPERDQTPERFGDDFIGMRQAEGADVRSAKRRTNYPARQKPATNAARQKKGRRGDPLRYGRS